MTAASTRVLCAGPLQVELAAQAGGGLRQLTITPGGEPWAIFAPGKSGDGREGATALGLNLLLPWSNRIRDGHFTWQGRDVALAAPFPADPHALHGDAWMRPWRSVEKTDTTARFELDVSDAMPPYRYRAAVDYALSPDGLSVQVALVSEAATALPYGIGLHPWLPRTPQTRLQAGATHVWGEDAQHLPTGVEPVAARPSLDFAAARTLPPGFVNNAFEGWSGGAVIDWPERALRLTVNADPSLGCYILFSPGERSGFFCFEPVSHRADAHNAADGAAAAGLTVLQPGEGLSARCHFGVEETS